MSEGDRFEARSGLNRAMAQLRSNHTTARAGDQNPLSAVDA
jgi:hypothetical protein